MIKLILLLIMLTLTIVVVTSDRFNYAFDYEFNVLTKECTYELYVQDRTQCIKPEYRD